MTLFTPECPACRVRMQKGFVIDTGHGGATSVTKWTEGTPEKGRITGHVKVKGLRQLEIVTFRCPQCGWLLWFAPDPPATSL